MRKTLTALELERRRILVILLVVHRLEDLARYSVVLVCRRDREAHTTTRFRAFGAARAHAGLVCG
jgi:hypothetical protein